MSVENQVRIYGNGVRAALLSIYNAHGDRVGEACGTRYAWEAAQVMAEIHGARRSVELIYRVADLIPLGNIEPTVAKAAEPASAAPPAVAERKRFSAIDAAWLMLLALLVGVAIGQRAAL